MKAKERICAAIKGIQTDRIPRGEFWLTDELVKMILGKKEISFEDEVQAYQRLGIDLRVVMCSGNMELMRLWLEKSDLFIMAGFAGPFESLCNSIGFNELMAMVKKKPEAVIAAFDQWLDSAGKQLAEAMEIGADGILIADDIAYNQSTYISRQHMQYMLFPYYRKAVSMAKERSIPAFFHSDGNLNQILSDLIEIGFVGLHSLEKEALMDIVEIKRHFGNALCLMGNISTPLLLKGTPLSIKEEINALLEGMGKSGGFILGSSSGILGADIPEKNLHAFLEVLTML